MNQNKKTGQGALEYLLLLVAAMFVVAIVFVFINSTIEPTKETGSQQTYDFLCNQLDGNTPDCACYTDNANNYYAADDGNFKQHCCNSDDSYLISKYEEEYGSC